MPDQSDPTTAVSTIRPDADWWRQSVVYQIYPRSFADANGDSVGDLRGITDRAPYLAELGIDAVWLSPFYPSELADGGYDVADYRDVDPRLGTLADFDAMMAAFTAAGIRVIVDLVPNHTSDQHVWFQEALASPPGSPARARYLFREGSGEHGELPPNDWPSAFGGPAWTRVTEADGRPGQWYLHLFAKEQPDLNWDNHEVHEDFLRTIRFWSDRGVAGFRVDVAHGLAKDLDSDFDPELVRHPLEIADGRHPFTDRDAVHEIYKEWRRVFNEYTPPRTAVAEAWVHPSRRARYASPEGLGQAFNFDLLKAPFDPQPFRDIIADNLDQAAASGASSTWVLSNHDVVRHPTRYGLRDPEHPERLRSADGHVWLRGGADPEQVDSVRGLRRARAATLLLFALPGSAYLYQGEELGLAEVGRIPADRRQDPAYFRSGGEMIGRDGSRVPLPWTASGSSFGFGSDGAHLPQPAWFADYAVSVEEEDPDSTLSFYRRALALRRELEGPEELDWEEAPEGVLHFARPGGWHVVMNFRLGAVDLPPGQVLLTSGPLDADGRLAGETTAWVRVGS